MKLNKKGMALSELLLGAGLFVMAAIPMTNAWNNFNDAKERVGAQANSKNDAIHLLQLIGHTIKFANQCRSTLSSLECDFPNPAGLGEVTRSFSFVDGELIHTLDGRELWRTEIFDYVVCNGDALADSQCLRGGTTLAGSTFTLRSPSSLPHYFRINLVVLLADGRRYPVQGGFFSRNMVPGGQRYRWTSMGGM